MRWLQQFKHTQFIYIRIQFQWIHLFTTNAVVLIHIYQRDNYYAVAAIHNGVNLVQLKVY